MARTSTAQRPSSPAETDPLTELADGLKSSPAESETAQETCKQEYPRTVKGKTVTGKCGKAKGHEGGHGRKPIEKTPAAAEVPADVLDSYEAVPSDEVVPVKADVSERSENQKKVDAQVKDSHESWIAAGSPKAFNDSPRKRYMLSPEHVAGMTKMLRRAERLHGVRVRIAPVKTHESGKSMLYWVAVSKKETTAAAETPGNSEGTAADAA